MSFIAVIYHFCIRSSLYRVFCTWKGGGCRQIFTEQTFQRDRMFFQEKFKTLTKEEPPPHTHTQSPQLLRVYNNETCFDYTRPGDVQCNHKCLSFHIYGGENGLCHSLFTLEWIPYNVKASVFKYIQVWAQNSGTLLFVLLSGSFIYFLSVGS